MSLKRTVPLLAVFAIIVGTVLFYRPQSAAGQVGIDIAQGVRDNANSILATDAARYLSGSGLNALNALSGKMPKGGSGINVAETMGSVAETIIEDESASALVNDPLKDVLANQDISSQSETAVAGFGPTIVVAYNDSPGFVFSGSGMGFSRSTDGGSSFMDLGNLPVPPTGFNGGDPGLVVNRLGHFYASSISIDIGRPLGFSSTIGIAKSTDGGVTFGLPVYLPPGGVLADSFQDKGFIAADTTATSTSGNVYVTFTSFPATFTEQLPIMFSRSTDGGLSFSTPIQISSAGTFNQGSEPAVGPSGEIYVAWLQFSGPGGAGIVVVKSTDGGLSFESPVFVAPVLESGFGSGQMSGNFRVNSFPRIDVNPINGHVYVTYGGRSGVPGDSGDVFFTRSTNGGASWSSLIRVNSDSGIKDQFFPDLAVNSDGVIRIFWYDKRRDPDNLRMTLFTATSTNNGVSFGPNEQLINARFLPAVGYDPILNPAYMGDYNDIKSRLNTQGRRTDGFLLSWGDFRRTVTTVDGVHPDQDVRFTKK